jgi:hypothetical protein
MIFNKIINNIYLLHKNLLDNTLSYDQINKLSKQTIFEPNEINIRYMAKNTYQTFYYILQNLYEYGKISNYKKFIEDKKYIQEIILTQDLDMNEVRKKTDLALENKSDLYYGVMRWISGCCWSNSLITNGYKDNLSDLDLKIITSINKTVEIVEPMSKSLVLFHGFENFSNYKEDELKVEKKFIFPGILSKTSNFEIAKQFAQSQNFFQPKYLVVFYPEGSKQIGLDIKPPKYDEYEYISKQNENLKITRICKIPNGLQLQILYICESLDYQKI